jgi:hypothetical protein
MFRDLLARDEDAVERFLSTLHDLPFADELDRALEERGSSLPTLVSARRTEPILRALLDAGGLGYAELPKALIPFHRYQGRSRTPLEEQLRETARLAGDRMTLCATVAPQARARFESTLQELLPRLRDELGIALRVELSEQSPSTDTLAVDLEGRPARDAEGRLLLRPGGHGALLRNLADLDAELVVIKNIDNVLPGPDQEESVEVERLLFGELLRLEERQHELQRRLARAHAATAADVAAARQLLAAELGRGRADELDGAPILFELLHRPLRVCAVVRNTGEPGGGPFWVRDRKGRVTPQIVESSQIDHADQEQAELARNATHFNPVLLVASLRDFRGAAYDLARFVDEETAFVTHKSADGKEIVALERPGLWNGSMAGWCTRFVEVLGCTFAPVKTVFDLLRDAHRGGARSGG